MGETKGKCRCKGKTNIFYLFVLFLESFPKQLLTINWGNCSVNFTNAISEFCLQTIDFLSGCPGWSLSEWINVSCFYQYFLTSTRTYANSSVVEGGGTCLAQYIHLWAYVAKCPRGFLELICTCLQKRSNKFCHFFFGNLPGAAHLHVNLDHQMFQGLFGIDLYTPAKKIK